MEQSGERGKYRLGFGIVRLAGAVTGRLDLTQQGRPVCERLAEDIGETVNMAVMREHYAINLYQVRGPAAVAAHNWVGELTPLHATSSGKVLLAYMPAQERKELLARVGLKKVTPHTITAKSALEKNLSEARERGYAFTLEELEIGLHAMAAPVRNQDGQVVAALSASGPSYRFTEERLHELSTILLSGAEEISHRMGHLAEVTSAGHPGARRPSRGRRRCGVRWGPGHRPGHRPASSSRAGSARTRRSPAG